MSFFSEASLAMIPSGYKTSKVYSALPITGDGDLTFSRSNDTATRVGPNGYIEKVRTNLITYSQAFDDAAWTKGGVGTYTGAITTGFTDPTGGTNAQRWVATIGSVSDRSFVRQLATLTSGIPYAISFWVKSNTGSNQELYTQFEGAATSTIVATTTWTRVTYSQVTSTTSVNVGFEAKDLAIDILVYGFQLESGDVMTDYIATTSAAVSVGPVANVPRLDYLDSTSPRLLLEPQRTNSAIYSEQFTNAAWTGGGATAVANQAVSPDGYTNADLIHPTISGNYIGKYQNIATATTGVVSCYVKQAGKRFAQLGTDNNATYTCAFDLQLGTVVRTATNYTATITSVGNGWFRITAAYVSSAAQVYPFVGVSDDADGVVTLDGTNGLYVYGFQYELSASYATSYIPTLGAAVTRGADFGQKSSISGLFGATATTFVFDFIKKENAIGWTITGDDGTKLFSLCQFDNTSGIPRVVFDDGVDTTSTLAALSNGRHKIAISYATNDTRIYIDGTLVLTDTVCTYYQMNKIGVNGTSWTGFTNNTNAFEINQFLMIPAATSNADLATLTTI